MIGALFLLVEGQWLAGMGILAIALLSALVLASSLPSFHNLVRLPEQVKPPVIQAVRFEWSYISTGLSYTLIGPYTFVYLYNPNDRPLDLNGAFLFVRYKGQLLDSETLYSDVPLPPKGAGIYYTTTSLAIPPDLCGKELRVDIVDKRFTLTTTAKLPCPTPPPTLGTPLLPA